MVERLGFGSLARMGAELSALEFQMQVEQVHLEPDDFMTDDERFELEFERDQLRALRQSGQPLSEEQTRRMQELGL